VIVAYIVAYKLRFGVEQICRVLTEHAITISPSTYYARCLSPLTQAELEDAYAAHEVFCLFHDQRGLYGVLKLWHSLRRRGRQIGRDQVVRLMGICGVTGIVRGKRATVTTEGDPTAARHPDLIDRQWDTPQCPDQWWVADFTYVWTLAGFCYVAFVVDVYSRRILGWRASMSKRSDLVLSALEQAIGLRRRGAFEFTSTGLVHHSDAGSQYVSLAMTEALREAGMDGSIGSVGDALDNALMESTIGLYKTELIDLEHSRRWSGRNEVERETADWVRWFNDERLHSSIGYRPPVEYEQLYHSDTTAEAQAA